MPGLSATAVALVGALARTDHLKASRRLLPFGETERRLDLVNQAYLGIRAIEVARIVGSVDRAVDFDRDFRPRTAGLAERLRALRRRFPDGNFPAISVYQVAAAYFVVDGHHRVALARQLGAAYIDAHVVCLDTEYDLSETTDVLTLVHTQQQRRFLRESGVDAIRPDAPFELLRPDGYDQLLRNVQTCGYRCSLAAGRLLSREDIAADWFNGEYMPAVAAIHEIGLDRRYAFKSDADLYLWVDAKRRALEPLCPGTTWLDAARAADAEFHGPLSRRRLVAWRRQPLRRRSA